MCLLWREGREKEEKAEETPGRHVWWVVVHLSSLSGTSGERSYSGGGGSQSAPFLKTETPKLHWGLLVIHPFLWIRPLWGWRGVGRADQLPQGTLGGAPARGGLEQEDTPRGTLGVRRPVGEAVAGERRRKAIFYFKMLQLRGREGWIGRAWKIFRTLKLLCDTIIIDTCHSIFAQIHKMYTKSEP